MRTASTDAQGGFVVGHLPAGRYFVNVTHRSYLNGSVGQKKPAGQGTPFDLADGQRTSVTVKMIRGGVITGTVYGAQGEPISNAQVTLFRYTYNGGVRRLRQAAGSGTDDRGVYRLHGLQPGDYFVAATHSDYWSLNQSSAEEMALIEQAAASGAIQPPAAPGLPATVRIPVTNTRGPGPFNQPPGYLPTFYPSALSAVAAQRVRVEGGDEHSGVDVNIRMVVASNVHGVITNPPGSDVRVQIQALSDDPHSTGRGGTSVMPDGSFLVQNLSPGTYTIVAMTVPQRSGMSGPPSEADLATSMWARTSVTVTGEPHVAASLTLQPGRTISGRLVLEMARPPDLSQSTVTVRLSPAVGPAMPMMMGPTPSARVDADGGFTLRGVPAGRYRIQVNGPYTRSAMVHGQDILDFPLEFDGMEDLTGVVLTSTDRVSELSGTLTPADGLTGVDYTVVVVPTDERYWLPGSRRIVTARPRADGVYRLRGLPAGGYFLGAVTDIEQGAQYDPEFIKAFLTTPGVFVTLSEGERITRDIGPPRPPWAALRNED
jgi:hypothetical protein